MTQRREIYKSAPLPFQGQKRHFGKEFRAALDELNAGGRITTIVDLFGGSGLLSHTAKRHLPHARVIFNDFGGYTDRLRAVPGTNAILAELRTILAELRTILADYPRHKLLTPDIRAAVLRRVEAEAAAGYVDYITLSSSLLFSSKYVLNFNELAKASLYNNVRTTDYDVRADDYLEGLEITRDDYQVLFERFRGVPGVVFLIDPPYLSTNTDTYNSDKYWRLKDYLNVLKVLLGSRYIYFTSNKSSLPELGEWLGENVGLGNPFEGAELRTRTNHVNPLCSYEDMMFYKLSA